MTPPPTRRAFLKTTAVVAAGAVAVRMLPRPAIAARAARCDSTPGDAFPLTLPFALGDDCAPPMQPTATATAATLPTPTPWQLWLPRVNR